MARKSSGKLTTAKILVGLTALAVFGNASHKKVAFEAINHLTASFSFEHLAYLLLEILAFNVLNLVAIGLSTYELCSQENPNAKFVLVAAFVVMAVSVAFH